MIFYKNVQYENEILELGTKTGGVMFNFEVRLPDATNFLYNNAYIVNITGPVNGAGIPMCFDEYGVGGTVNSSALFGALNYATREYFKFEVWAKLVSNQATLIKIDTVEVNFTDRIQLYEGSTITQSGKKLILKHNQQYSLRIRLTGSDYNLYNNFYFTNFVQGPYSNTNVPECATAVNASPNFALMAIGLFEPRGYWYKFDVRAKLIADQNTTVLVETIEILFIGTFRSYTINSLLSQISYKSYTINAQSVNFKSYKFLSPVFTPSGYSLNNPLAHKFSKNLLRTTPSTFHYVKNKIEIQIETFYGSASFTTIATIYDFYTTANIGSYIENIVDAILESNRFSDITNIGTVVYKRLYTVRNYKCKFYYLNGSSYTYISGDQTGIVILGKQTFLEYKDSTFWSFIKSNYLFLSKLYNNKRQYAQGFEEKITYPYAFTEFSTLYFVIRAINTNGITKRISSTTISSMASGDMYDVSFKITDTSDYKTIQACISQDQFGRFPMSQMLEYEVIKYNEYPARAYRYRNQWGGWDTLYTTGKRIDNVSTEKETFDKTLKYNYSIVEGASEVVVNQDIQSFEQNTGYLSEAQMLNYREFLMAKDVFEVTPTQLLPIIVMTKSLEYYGDNNLQSDKQFTFKAQYLFESIV